MIKEEIGIYQDPKNKKTTIVIHNMSKRTRDIIASALLNDLEVQTVTGLTEIGQDMTCIDPNIDGMTKVEPEAKSKKTSGAKKSSKDVKETPAVEAPVSGTEKTEEPEVSKPSEPQDNFMNTPVTDPETTSQTEANKPVQEPVVEPASTAQTAPQVNPSVPAAPVPEATAVPAEEIQVVPVTVPDELMPPADAEEPYDDEPVSNASETVGALWQGYDETKPIVLLKEFISIWANGMQDEKVAAAIEIEKLMEMTARNRRRVQSLFWDMQCFKPYADALMSAARQKGFGDCLTIGSQEYMNTIVNTLNALSDDELMVLAKGAAKNMLSALTPLFTIN